MKAPIKWMAANPVAANLLMMIFIIGGIIMGYNMKQEVFPEIELDRIQVSVEYPGAGPEEVEEGILLKVEDSITGIEGIKEIKSVASEGQGIVMSEVLLGEDVDLVLQDIKAEVDRIITFSEEAEKPIVTKLVARREVIFVAVYGNAPERGLRELAEQVREDLLFLPEITQTDLIGVRPYEISIEVPEENLRQYNLTLDQIAERVKRASIDMPAGAVKSEGGEVLIRTKEKRYHGTEYASITVLEKEDGAEVRLRDIAVVKDTFRETDVFAKFNGMPAAMIAVYRVGDQKPTTISKIVKKYVKEKSKTLPDSVHIATWNDSTELLKSRMNLLLKNAFLGLILVSLILGLFLRVRLAFWVMLGIPISFLGALFIMPALDVSINMISLFAFILALGIVVDDAIIVGENIYHHSRRNKTYQLAAVDGTVEVGTPVIFSVLTTIAAYLPLVFVTGTMGKFIKVIPFVVIPILVVSLIESLYILPAHLAHTAPPPKQRGQIGRFMEQLHEGFDTRLKNFIRGPYRRFLSRCISFRYLTFAVAIAIFFMAVGLLAGGIVKFRFMPKVDGDFITASLKMPIGTPVTQTTLAQQHIVEKAKEVVAGYDSERKDKSSVLRHIYSLVGSKIPMGLADIGSSSGAHFSDVLLFLTQSEKRGVSSAEIANRWREEVGEIPGADSLVFSSELVRFGKNIDIRLSHDNFDVLTVAARRVKEALAQYPGVSDIDDNYTKGKRELKLKLKSEARTLGITEENLGRQIRSAFYGAEALRLQRGRNEVKIMVRYPEEDRKSLGDLESMRIHTPNGTEVPFSSAAEVHEGRGYSQINRTDRKRSINVAASVDSKKINAEEVVLDLQKTVLNDLKIDYPGLTYDMEGEEKERKDSMQSMMKGFAIILFMIYALLAVPFKSYSQPLLIMTSIPFGLVGALLGHWIMGFDLSMLSLFGIVALTGVVVNDSLLLIDTVNRKRQQGIEEIHAVKESAERRFRPILLTSLTTAFGLLPMILEKSMQAQFLIPMAISLAFGILFATGITLLLVPSLYLILEDVKGLFRQNRHVENSGYKA